MAGVEIECDPLDEPLIQIACAQVTGEFQDRALSTFAVQHLVGQLKTAKRRKTGHA